MPEKKYNEFPDGTYDTSKIFLQASAIDGSLEKVFLPPISPAIRAVIRLDFMSDPDAAATPFYGIQENQINFFSDTGGAYQFETINGFLFDPDAEPFTLTPVLNNNSQLYIVDRSNNYLTFQTRENNIIADVDAVYWIILFLIPA